MNDVPIMGSPRGPGGRLGVGLGDAVVAEADMNRELLGRKDDPIHDTPRYQIDVVGVYF